MNNQTKNNPANAHNRNETLLLYIYIYIYNNKSGKTVSKELNKNSEH